MVEAISTYDAFKDTRVHEYLVIAALTFLIYDHILTFDTEKTYFWRRPLTQSAIWFFLNRYLAFFGHIIAVTLEISDFHSEKPFLNCFFFNLFRELLVFLNVLLVSLLLVIRTYALYNRSRRMLVFLLVSLLSLVALAFWFTFGSHNSVYEEPLLGGCYTGMPTPLAIRFAAAYETSFIFDTLIFCLTAFKTWKGRHGVNKGAQKISLIALILRDGILYYGAMVAANFVNVMTTYFTGPYLRGSLSPFTTAICVTLMSRLMLNLHVSADTVRIHQAANSSILQFQSPPGQVHNLNFGGALSRHQYAQGPGASFTTSLTQINSIPADNYEKPPSALESGL